jgi:solute carrier family 35 protein C2
MTIDNESTNCSEISGLNEIHSRELHHTIHEGEEWDPEPIHEDDIDKRVTSCYNEHCIYLLPMLGWFAFSSALSMYNKYVFGKNYMAFPCPLLMTSVHFGVQFIFSYSITKRNPRRFGGDQIDEMPWKTYLCVAVPCGLVTALDVGFSNLAMVRITITFYTMVKSSAPIFVVISAFIFGLEKMSWSLISTVLIISVGECITVMGEVQFDLIGFLLVLAAAVLSGMRWTLVQLQLESLEPRLKSSFATMRILAPFMWLSMLILSLTLEKPWTKFGTQNDGELTDQEYDLGGAETVYTEEDAAVLSYSYFGTPTDAMWTLGIALFGGALAVCMILCEFYLIMNSSAIILMLGGVCKELTTIILGVTFFGDNMNAVNEMGCGIVFSGVLLYKFSLYMNKQEKFYDTLDVDSHGSTELRERMVNGSFDENYSSSPDYDDGAIVKNGSDMNGLTRRKDRTSDGNNKDRLPSLRPNQEPLVHSNDTEII